MSSSSPRPHLKIDADLQVTIDGVEARLVGSNSDLTVHTDEPARLADVLRRGDLTAAAGQFTRLASVADVRPPRVTIEGPRGRVARIESGGGLGVRVRGMPRGTRLQIYRPQDFVPAGRVWKIIAAAAIVAIAVGRVRRR